MAPALVDQGGADSFLGEDAEGAAPGSGAVNQLLPEHLRAACAEVGQRSSVREIERSRGQIRSLKLRNWRTVSLCCGRRCR